MKRNHSSFLSRRIRRTVVPRVSITRKGEATMSANGTNGVFYRGMAFIVWILVISLLVQPSAAAFASLQENGCDAKLKEAQDKFYDGKFDETIALTKECIDKGNLTEEQKKRGYELLGQALIAKEYLDQANDAIRKLLKIVPNYTPDLERVTPTFAQQVNKIKAEEQQEQQAAAEEKPKEGGFDMKWVYIGGGVLVAGAAVLLIAGGSKKEESKPLETLPGPPALP